MALGAARSAVHHRQPSGGRQQHRNRGGCARARDGYTLLIAGTFNAINATLYDNLKFNFIRDIAPVATIYYVPNVMAVHPSFPAKTILEFIAYSKSNPGK